MARYIQLQEEYIKDEQRYGLEHSQVMVTYSENQQADEP